MNILAVEQYKDTQVTTYKFGPHTYSHVGAWPPVFQPGIFSVPFKKVLTDDGRDVTNVIKRYAGPRHVITDEVIACAFGTRKPVFKILFVGGGIRFTNEWRLIPHPSPPCIHVTTILDQSITFGAK